MLLEAAGRGQHFQARGYSFSLSIYRLTLSQTITSVSFFLALNWLTSGLAPKRTC